MINIIKKPEIYWKYIELIYFCKMKKKTIEKYINYIKLINL